MDSIKDAIKELQEAAVVTAEIQRRQSEMLKEHAEWLVAHDKAMTEIREKGRQTDERIDRLVIAIGQLIARESRQ